jgi:hyperosmotically inducible protein
MNAKSLFAATLLGSALAIGAVGCANITEKSAGQNIDDATITTKVKAKFVEDPVVKAMNIHVNVYKGVVQLSGFANTTAEADKAAMIARDTSGVVSVKNDIRLAAK